MELDLQEAVFKSREDALFDNSAVFVKNDSVDIALLICYLGFFADFVLVIRDLDFVELDVVVFKTSHGVAFNTRSLNVESAVFLVDTDYFRFATFV